MIKETEALEELGEWKQWVMWKVIDGKKRPFGIDGFGIGATSKHEKRWMYYDRVKRALDGNEKVPVILDDDGKNLESAPGWGGIGFVFTEDDPFVGVDIDKCIDEDGKISDFAQKIIKELDSYTELSPSGTGVHIICKGNHIKVGHNPRGKEPVEMYSWGRYFTFNGQHIDGTPEEINDRTEILTAMEKRLYGGSKVIQPETWEGIDFCVHRGARAPVDKLKELLKENKSFKKTWNRKRDDIKEKSYSDLDCSIAICMVEDGWEPAEVAGGLIEYRDKWCKGADFEKALRVDYIGRTWAKAVSCAEQGIDEEDLQLDSAKDQGGEEVLVQVSGMLKIMITQFAKYGGEPCGYFMRVEGKLVKLGLINDLTNGKVRNVILDATRKGIKRLKPAKWDKIIELLLSVVEEKEVLGLGRVEEVKECMDEYFEARTPYTDDFKIAHQLSLPYANGGYMHMSRQNLIAWILQTHPAIKMNPAELGLTLGELGWATKQVSHSIEGIVVTRNYFRKRMEEK